MDLPFLDNIQLVFETWPMVFYIFIVVLGLMIGSFLNVVIYRLPVMMEREFKDACVTHFDEFQPKKSIATKGNDKNPQTAQARPETFNLAIPASTCPKCGHNIRAWENIPVISWLLLKGKCSACRAPISMRYPAIEALTGVLSVLMAWHFGVSILTLFALVLVWSLITLTFIDLDEMLLPDQITLPLMWFGLLLSLNGYFVTPTEAILGAALGYLVYGVCSGVLNC